MADHDMAWQTQTMATPVEARPFGSLVHPSELAGVKVISANLSSPLKTDALGTPYSQFDGSDSHVVTPYILIIAECQHM